MHCISDLSMAVMYGFFTDYRMSKDPPMHYSPVT